MKITFPGITYTCGLPLKIVLKTGVLLPDQHVFSVVPLVVQHPVIYDQFLSGSKGDSMSERNSLLLGSSSQLSTHSQQEEDFYTDVYIQKLVPICTFHSISIKYYVPYLNTVQITRDSPYNGEMLLSQFFRM